MRPLGAAATAVGMLLLGSALAGAQDASPKPPVTVVPDAQFCNLVADDLEACEQALTTLASAGMVPESFASLITSPAEPSPPAGASDAAITYEGEGSVKTKAFELAAGDYQVTIDTDCTSGYWVLEDTSGAHVSGGLFEQSGYIYGLPEGRYYWDVGTGNCAWTVTIQPA